MSIPVIGRCHICRRRLVVVVYCPACEHWFCEMCRGKWFRRGLEWIKELVQGSQEGCCGPT